MSSNKRTDRREFIIENHRDMSQAEMVRVLGCSASWLSMVVFELDKGGHIDMSQIPVARRGRKCEPEGQVIRGFIKENYEHMTRREMATALGLDYNQINNHYNALLLRDVIDPAKACPPKMVTRERVGLDELLERANAHSMRNKQQKVQDVRAAREGGR